MFKKFLSSFIIIGGLLSSLLFLESCTLEDFVTASKGMRTDSSLTLDQKVVLGLRTALKVGIDSSANIAGKANGYLASKVIKILLPEEAKQALAAAEEVGNMLKPFASQLTTVQTVANLTLGTSDKNSLQSNLNSSNTLLTDLAGLSSISDSLIKYMNRAAEYAAPRSVPIFKSAITGMSITDGLTLLNSSDSTAATAYLNGKTFNPLINAYTPLVDSTLRLVPLTKYWSNFRTTYNSALSKYNELLGFQNSWNTNTLVINAPVLKLTALKQINYNPIVTESLGTWTTDKALGGLFYLVGEEEKDIRRDPFGYIKNIASDISGILKEVFGEIMKMGTK